MWKHKTIVKRIFENLKKVKEIIRRIKRKCLKRRISYKERMEDALVHGAEEGRDKLRKAAVSCK